MKKDKYTYSTWQIASLVCSTLIGVGVLTLPRTSSELVHEAGWLATLLGGIVPLVLIMVIAFLSNRFPGLTLIEYSIPLFGSKRSARLGKILRAPIILIFLAMLYLGVGSTSRLFGEVVVTSVLLNTPLEVIILTMFALAVILCLHEPEVVARVNELLFPLIIIPILGITVISLQKADWNNLLPLFRSDAKALFESSLNTAFSYHGYQVMLIYFAFTEQGASRMRGGLIGVSVVIVVYTLVVIAGLLVFGSEELQKLTWPTLELVKSANIPGLILERLESAFLGVWVAAVFTTVGNVYYCVVFGIRQLFGRGMVFQRVLSVLLIFPLFYLSLVPQNTVEIFLYADYLGKITLIITIAILLLYLIVYLLKTARRKGDA